MVGLADGDTVVGLDVGLALGSEVLGPCVTAFVAEADASSPVLSPPAVPAVSASTSSMTWDEPSETISSVLSRSQHDVSPWEA